MITKKHIVALGMCIALAGSFILLKIKGKKEAQHNIFTIGILQTASHPALDAVKDGFVQELKELMPRDVEFIEQNAQANVAHAYTIAQSFHTDNNIDAIFAIATPALQAAASVEKKKPIFFGAVTEPRMLGIVHPTTNVAGSSDMTNVPDTITMLRELIPSAKTVALIYNNAEANSVHAAVAMKQELAKARLSVIDVGVTNEAELLPAIESALQKADVLLAPTDNTVASAIDMIAQKALAAKKPLIVSDNLLVSHGALAARGIDYKAHGRQVAQKAAAVLKNGKKPADLPIGYATSGRIFVNKKTIDALGLTVPSSWEHMVTSL